jgi:hypothetical protein
MVKRAIELNQTLDDLVRESGLLDLLEDRPKHTARGDGLREARRGGTRGQIARARRLCHVGTSYIGLGRAPGCSSTAGAILLSSPEDCSLEGDIVNPRTLRKWRLSFAPKT